jgi:hypothetical protein
MVLMAFKNLIQHTHRFRTLSFPFAFLLLTHRFGIMRDFAGQAFGRLWQRDRHTSESKRSKVPSFVKTQPLAGLPIFRKDNFIVHF